MSRSDYSKCDVGKNLPNYIIIIKKSLFYCLIKAIGMILPHVKEGKLFYGEELNSFVLKHGTVYETNSCRKAD
jgi:hypothetical protein